MAKNVTVSIDVNAQPLRDGLKKAGAALDEFENKEVEIPLTVDEDGAVKGVKDAGEKIEKEAKNIGEKSGKGFSEDFGSQLKTGLSGAFSNIGSAITGGIIGAGVAGGVEKAVGVITDGLSAVIEKGSEYQASLANLSAITGVSGDALEQFGEKGKELAAQFGGTANDQVKSFQTILSKFGPDLAKTPDALNKVTESVNLLSKASGLDATEAVDALTNSMLQFGIDASDPAKLASESGRFINVLAASAKEGAAEIPQVSEAILQAGVAAKGANLSFEETNAAIQALAVGGKTGSEAGVALRNVLGLLIKQSGPGAEALAGVGLSVDGLGKTLTEKGLSEALRELQGGIDKLGSDAEKAAFKATLFGTENASAAGILLDQVGTIETFTEKMTGTSEAVKQAEINMNTFSGFMDRAKASIGNAAISIFQGFEKAFTFIANAVSGTVGPALENIGGYIERVWSIAQPILALIGGAIIAGLVNTINLVATAWGTVFGILNSVFDGIVNALKPITDAFKNLFGKGGAAGQGLDLMKIFSGVLEFFASVLKKVGEFIGFVAGKIINFLLTPLRVVGQAVADVINWFGAWINKLGDLQTIITVVVEKIGNLVKAVISFDLGAIKDAILDFGNIGDDVKKRMSEAAKATNTSADANEKAATEQKKLNTEIQNQPDGAEKKEKDADAAKKLAEELKKAKEALADLNSEQEKQAKLNAAETLETVEAREKRKLEIETEYQKKSLEKDIANLESTGELRTAQEAVIRKKIELLEQESAEKLKKIQAKSNVEKVKIQEENEKLLNDVTLKFAEERAKVLRQKLADGDVAIAKDLINSVRSISEEALSQQIDSIVESTPEFKSRVSELGRQLAEGLIDKDKYSRLSDEARQTILARLQSLPADTTDAYAQKIRLAYEKSTNEILDQTRDILAKVNEIQKKNQLPKFADSLINLGDVIKSVKFEEIFGKSAETLQKINEDQEKLVQQVKDGTLSYQDAVDKLDELEDKAAGVNSAALQAIAEVFNAFAQSQLEAFNSTTQAADKLIERNKEINKQIVELEKLKNQELAVLREEDALKREEIEKRFNETKAKLEQEATENTKKAADLTSAAYENLAASAASSFAGMVLSGENALKAMVLVALDALESLVPILVAQIIGQSLAANPILGAVVGAAATATLYALVAAAKAAVANGFKEGGFTGNLPTNQIAGVVHGGEFVMTAQATKKNRALLEHLHAGRPLESFPALNRVLRENSIAAFPVSEFQMMRSELTAIRQKLDSFPSQSNSKVGLDLNIGMDAYLYEKDRSRMMARKLRG